jgi:HEAT repeat protein
MADRDVTRARYLEALLATYGTVRLPIRSGEHSLPLQAIFQPLRLRSGSFSFEGADHEDSDTTTARNGAEALAKSGKRRMVVLGGPGMGKTTLLKELLQRAIQAAQVELEADLPLFISLPDLARSGLTWQEYLPGILAELDTDANFARTLIEAIEHGRAFLCLDSLDEVVPAQRPDIIALLDREAARCGGTWIIGSRFTEYKGGQFAQGQFAEWELQPLDKEMRLELAKHLLPLISHLLQQPATSSAEDFIEVLDKDARLAEWGTNPLLFTLAAIVYAQTGMLPGSRATLYRECIEIMLVGRIPDQQARAELRNLLADISLQLYQTRGRNFTVPELFELLTTRYPDASYQAHSDMVARILDAGLLDVVAHQTYGFKHQMFQEYLAAVALATQLVSQNEVEQQAGWDFAWRKHTYSRWREILRLCVGVLVQEQGERGNQIAANWLHRLAAEHDTPAGDVGNLCLELALGSLREFATALVTSELTETAQALVMAWAKLLVKRLNWYVCRLTEDIKMLDLDLVLPTITWLENRRDCGYQDEDIEDIESKVNSGFSWLDVKISNITIPARVFTHAYPNPQGISLYASVLPATLQAYASQEQIIKLAQSHEEHWRVRLGAIALLGEWKGLASIDVLCEILENTTNEHRIRTVAAEMLSAQRERLPIERLLPLLQDKDKRIRVAVVDVLASTQQPLPLEPLFILLDDTKQVSDNVLAALMRMDHQKTTEFEPFMRMLLDDNANRRAAALYLLGSHTPLESLITAMRDTSQQVSGAALRVASSFGERVPTSVLLEFLNQHHSDTRIADVEDKISCEEAIEMLQQPGRAISGEFLCTLALKYNMLQFALSTALTRQIALPVDVLVEAAFHTYNHDIFSKAKALLARINEHTSVVTLIETLQNGSSQARLNAAQMLSLHASLAPLAQESILYQLQKLTATLHIGSYTEQMNNGGIYNYLVISLVRSGASVPIEFLLNALRTHWSSPDQERDEVVLALGMPGAQAPLIELLRMVSENIHGYNHNQERRTTQALVSLYTWITPEMLQEMSQQQRLEDEFLALNILEAMGKQAPVELLKNILDDTNRNRHVRSRARSILHTSGIHLPLTYFLAEAGIGRESTDSETIESTRELGPRAPIEELLQILTWTYDWTKVPFFLAEMGPSFSAEAEQEESNLAHETAVEALRAIAPYVLLEPLVAALDHRSAMVRNGAVRVLGAFGERAPIDKLLAFQKKHGTQDELWETLTELRSYVPLEALTAALSDFNKRMRRNPFDLLEKWGRAIPLEPLLALANDHEYKERAQAIMALGYLQDRAPLDFLLALLISEDDEEVESAAYALSQMGPYAPLDTLRALYNDKSEMHEHLLSAFGDMGEYAPLDVILQALDDEDHYVRKAAGYALWYVAKAAPTMFIAAMKDNRRPPVREALMEAIAHMGKDAPLDLALIALHDEHEEVRFQARWALTKLNVDPALLSIQPLLDEITKGKRGGPHSTSNSHWTELELLAKMGPRVPAEPLLALLGDSDLDTCKYAAKALYQTHPEEFAEVARQAEAILRGEPTGSVFASRVQSRIAERVAAIGHATPAVLAMITDLLDWPYWEVRMKAAQALEAVHRNIPDRAIRRLLELRHDPASLAVREAADKALAEILSRESGMEDE